MATTLRVLKVQNACNGSGQNLVAASSGKSYQVLGMVLTASVVDTTFTLRSNTTSISGSFVVAAKANITLPIMAEPWFSTTSGEALTVLGTNTGVLSGHIVYNEVTA